MKGGLSFFLVVLCFYFGRATAQSSEDCLIIKTEVLTPFVTEGDGVFIIVRYSLPAGCEASSPIIIISKERNDTLTYNDNDFRNAASATEAVFMPGASEAFSRIPVTNHNDIEPFEEPFLVEAEIKKNDFRYGLGSEVDPRYALGSSSIRFIIGDDDNDPANKKYVLSYPPVINEGEAVTINITLPFAKYFPDSLKLRFEPEVSDFNAQTGKDYSMVIKNIPPRETETSISISAMLDKLIEGDEFIKGRIVIYDAAWDDASTYTTEDVINIKIIDKDSLKVNRVIEITPALNELIEGGRITYTLRILSPYNVERPLTVNINAVVLPGYVNHSTSEVTLSEQAGSGTVTFNYPDNDNIDLEELIEVALSATDPHIGDFTFLFKNEEASELSLNTLDNDSDIEIPNAFTPNGDGINDTWVISGIENNQKSLVQIFSRTGEKVFEARVYDNNWNGRKNNRPLPQGVYYYKIFHQKNYPIRTGTVTIVY